MKSYADKRLDSVYANAERIPFDNHSKYIVMSDCHRGQGNVGDNFLPNQNLFFGALKYYYDKGFSYIEIGDGDELWENRDLKSIIEVHNDVFELLRRFYNDGRYYMLYGNHDVEKGKIGYAENNYSSYYCEIKKSMVPLFPDLQIREGLVLKHIDTGQDIFFLHGHQGELLNDRLWKVARFLVRYLWRRLELIGFLDPTKAARSNKVKERIEQRLDCFAQQQEALVVAGHTHRPFFSRPGEGRYFNDGSSVHPRSITGIEIEKNQISLIKWSIGTREDRGLYVEREVLDGPVDIKEYSAKLHI